jgi:hypothetical protein
MAAPSPRSSRKAPWIGAAAAVLLAGLLYRHFDRGRLLTLEQLKAGRDVRVGVCEARPAATLLAFFGVYVLAAALSIPGALILTLAAGEWRRAHAPKRLLEWLRRYRAWERA